MDVLKFAFKLLKHGGIFLLRVIGIVVPAVSGSMASALGRAPSAEVRSDADYRYAASHFFFPDGSQPEIWDSSALSAQRDEDN